MILVGEVVCSFELLSGMFEIHGPALLDAIQQSHVGELNLHSGMQSFPGVSSTHPTRAGKRALSPPPLSPPRQPRPYSPPPPSPPRPLGPPGVHQIPPGQS